MVFDSEPKLGAVPSLTAEDAASHFTFRNFMKLKCSCSLRVACWSGTIYEIFKISSGAMIQNFVFEENPMLFPQD